ncbi:MAG TPA: hypothetical protein VGB17_05525 [Pyrinomonadaceae bacterium]|jgi:hypothetical protein
MLTYNGITQNGWLAFELGVLRRLDFKSVALGFAGEPDLGLYLKRWNVRVAAADSSQWAWTKATAYIENNTERLTEDDLELLLEDAYVPRAKLSNAALGQWFSEMDAWWFDNVRVNAERLATPTARALALSLGMMVGDYVLSFDEETRRLRQPLALADVFRRAWQAQPRLFNNTQRNTSANMDAHEFIAEQRTDLLFLRLPRARGGRPPRRNSVLAWREEWVRGGSDFWDELERRRAGRLGSYVETRQQYLQLVEELLRTAAHLPAWAIAYAEDGFVSTQELVETIGRVRRVENIYTKDFTELMGTRAVIITA